MSETIVEMRAAHRAGRSPVETIRAVYERIAAHADPAIFITLRPEAEVSAEAEVLEKSGVSDKPLFGVPFVVKDNIDVEGLPTTAACPAFAYVPLKSAHAVQRLVDAGAILIGKTNLDQFATGLVGMRSPYGVPRNALKAEIIPGGSSSGSAVAVAAGIVPFSFGTDTAGSGRVPAALNGIVGLKPSLGLISTAGVLPACRTLDCVSIFAQTVEDAETVLGIAAAYDPDDPFSRRFGSMLTGAMPPVPRIAVPDAASRRFFGDTHAETAFAADCAMLKDLGATLTEIDLSPFYAVAQLLYDGPWVAERYAAIRTFIETQPEAMHPVTRTITQSALEHSAISTFEALYELRRLKRETETALAGFDALVVPSIPGVYTVAELEAEPIALNSNLGTYTNFVNLLDLSAIAVPSGARGDGLPSSITLIGRAGADAHLAAIARAVQQKAEQPMGASRRRPPVPAPAPMLAPAGAIEIAVVGGASFRHAAQPRTHRTRGRLPARGGDAAGLRALRACWHDPAETWPSARRGRGRTCDQGRDLGAFAGRLRALRLTHPRAARHRHDFIQLWRRGAGLPVRSRGGQRRKERLGLRRLARLCGLARRIETRGLSQSDRALSSHGSASFRRVQNADPTRKQRDGTKCRLPARVPKGSVDYSPWGTRSFVRKSSSSARGRQASCSASSLRHGASRPSF